MNALPICSFEQQILDSVNNFEVTIIQAETGAGKSTQVPQMLNKAGHHVIVTQPRKIAAVSLAKRVAEEMKVNLGDKVGYATGESKKISNSTEIMYVTDGLQLVRELTAQFSSVLVIDEVHEWNLNQEVLIAWSKSILNTGRKFVIMSATMEAEKLASYFGNANVISVPGRTFPVTKYIGSPSEIATIATEMAKLGHNVLVFQPGKAEIEDTVNQVNAAGVEALALHGELSQEEQMKVFEKPETSRVVVSTNVAQTSVTIDYIDVVVDSGLERRTEISYGIEGLTLAAISKADSSQRAGRAGRVKAGKYYLCLDENEAQKMPEFPVAEILRSNLESVYLKLVVAGFNPEKLEFFHQPNGSAWDRARKSLVSFGAITNEGLPTAIGRQMVKMPLSPRYARMMVEAIERDQVSQTIILVACLEAGPIYDRRKINWRSLTSESSSDVLAQFDIYNKAVNIQPAKDMSYSEALRNRGLSPRAFFNAKEIIRKLNKIFECSDSETNRDKLKIIVLSGFLDNVYRIRHGVSYDENGNRLSINKDSVTQFPSEAIVAALPFVLSGKNARGHSFQIHLLNHVTVIKNELSEFGHDNTIARG